MRDDVAVLWDQDKQSPRYQDLFIKKRYLFMCSSSSATGDY